MVFYLKVSSDNRITLPIHVRELFEVKCFEVSWTPEGLLLKQVPEDMAELKEEGDPPK